MYSRKKRLSYFYFLNTNIKSLVLSGFTLFKQNSPKRTATEPLHSAALSAYAKMISSFTISIISCASSCVSFRCRFSFPLCQQADEDPVMLLLQILFSNPSFSEYFTHLMISIIIIYFLLISN